MTIEVKPVGNRCNLCCAYCYESGARHTHVPLDKAAVFQSIDRANGSFHLFGGEALLLPLDELEEFVAYGFQKFGHVGLQTNGSLITDAHIQMFAKYCVETGISIDGPGELNDARCGSRLAVTRTMTAQTESAIEALINAGRIPSLIITLSQANVGTPDRLERFIGWIRYLRSRGVRHINPHFLEPNGNVGDLLLPDRQLTEVLMALWAVQDEDLGLTMSLFSDVLNILQGDDVHVVCTYRSCDPWNTPSCNGIEPNGEPSMCGRVHKDGIDWNPAAGHSYERQLALAITPQEHGGCQGCEYWIVCTGNCPGGAIDNDWRNRNGYCRVLKDLFAEGERRLTRAGIRPVTQAPDRDRWAQCMWDAWVAGTTPSLAGIVAGGKVVAGRSQGNRSHGDHTNAAKARHADSTGHGNVPHGDRAHGDSHGDSNAPRR